MRSSFSGVCILLVVSVRVGGVLGGFEAGVFALVLGVVCRLGRHLGTKALADETPCLLVRREVFKGRQVVQVVQAKALKEGLRGAKRGGTGPLAMRELAHTALVDERGNSTVGTYATHRAHAVARGWLRVGNDGKRLKRGGGEVALALDELDECTASAYSLEREVENRELAAALNRFLAQLPETERALFVSRYWFLAPVAELSKKFGFSESKTASMLHRTRGRLRRFLIEEGLA